MIAFAAGEHPAVSVGAGVRFWQKVPSCREPKNGLTLHTPQRGPRGRIAENRRDSPAPAIDNKSWPATARATLSRAATVFAGETRCVFGDAIT